MTRKQWKRRSWLTLCLFLVTSVMLLSSINLSGIAGLVPMVITSGTLALLLIQLVSEFMKPDEDPGDPGITTVDESAKYPEKREKAGSFARSIAWLALLPCCVWTMGLILGPAFYCIVFLRGYAQQTWFMCLAYSLTVAVAVATIFLVLPGTAPYQGLLGVGS